MTVPQNDSACPQSPPDSKIDPIAQAPTIPTQSRAKQVFDFLNHTLVAGFILAVLGVAGWYVAKRYDEAEKSRESRLMLARDVEAWATRYVLTVRNAANISATYGDSQRVRTALDALKGLQNDDLQTFSTRSVELHTLFGPEAKESLEAVRTAGELLRQCFEIIADRIATNPAENPDSHERTFLRNECSAALKRLDAARSVLLETVVSRISADAGGHTHITASKVEWVPTSLKVNGLTDEVILRGEPFTYTWYSPDAIICQIEAPTGPSGSTRMGVGGPVTVDHPWYPKPGSTSKLEMACTNLWTNGVSSVILRRAQ